MSLLGEQVGGNPLLGGVNTLLLGSDATMDVDIGMSIGMFAGIGGCIAMGTDMGAAAPVGSRQGLSRRPLAVRTTDTGM